jgi:hypothetical protein
VAPVHLDAICKEVLQELDLGFADASDSRRVIDTLIIVGEVAMREIAESNGYFVPFIRYRDIPDVGMSRRENRKR